MASLEKGSSVSGEGKWRQRIDLDTILVEELGQLGRYQVRVVLLAVLAVIFIGWTTNEFVFTAARIRTRCVIPECEQDGVTEFEPEWILNAVPAAGNSFDNCVRFASVASSRSGHCPAELFDRNRTVNCEGFVYENTNSIVYDFNLACDEWRRSLIGSVRTFGTLVAMPITGYMSDRWGRKTVLSIVVFNGAWLGIVRYWANTYIGYVISTFIESTLGSGGFACVYVMLMEVMGPKYRLPTGAILNCSFAVSQVLMALIAWAVPNWRKLTLSLYAPQLTAIAFFWIMSESVRWLMSKGRYDESEKILKQIARVNRTTLSEKSLQMLKDCAEEENRRVELKKLQKTNEPLLIVEVFRHKAVLCRCIVAPVWWITMTFIYYGLSINSVNMSGNQYLNYMAVSAVEIPGFWTAVFLMSKVGRKIVLTTAYWICAACQIGYIFMPNDQYGLSLAVYLIGKYSISTVVTTLYVYTAELYPTKHRHTLFAFCSMIGRIGSIIAPLTPAFGAAVWDELPFALFAGFGLLSGALVFLTPETKGAKLPDTMEQADRIGTNTDT
ncbi:organic cation transporter protein-like [Epargyreus clarus]|uniref:organic cation transporter protein-like n=1 Tax=Epargyreus clarus TaxID=520877 RepID=UPI003C3048EF